MKESYLMWLEGKVALILGEDDGDGKDDNKVVVGNETTTTTEVNKTLLITTNKSSTSYTLAKKAPFPNMAVDILISDYGAEDFILALTTFLLENVPECKISPKFTPNQYDRFNIFKQVIITLPPNLFLSNQSQTCRLRSTPAVKPKG